MENIKHIIFDLGGVIINIDYNRTAEAFKALGVTDFDDRYSQAAQTDLFSDFETGKIDEAAFVKALQEWTGTHISHQQILDAWNAMLLDIPLRRLQILQQLQLHYDIVLLSNTNETHERAFNKVLKEVCGFDNLGVFFDKVFYSHRIGLRKPNADIFQHVLDYTGFNPAHTLFLDDSLQHIEGARATGIQTIWMEPGMTMEETIFRPKQ